MKTPDLRRRIRLLFAECQERRLQEIREKRPLDDVAMEVTAGELVTFIQQLAAAPGVGTVDDDTAQRRVATALLGLYDLVDQGTLVRNISRDHEPGWALRMLELAMVLKRAGESIDVARERGWIG